MIWTKEQFDRIFNNDDIKNWNSHQIKNSILKDEPMIKDIRYLAYCAGFEYFPKNQHNLTNPIIEDMVKNIIFKHYLQGVPWVPKFWLDYGYALQAMQGESQDYLGWWYKTNCTNLYVPKQYKGIRFYEYLQQRHHCDWGKIAMKMKPIHHISKNAKPNFR